MPSLHYYALPVRPVEEDGWSMASLKIICLIWFVGIFSPSATETRPGWDRKPVVGVCWNIGSIWTLFRNLTRQEIDIDHDEHLLTWAAWQAGEDRPGRFLVQFRFKSGLFKIHYRPMSAAFIFRVKQELLNFFDVSIFMAWIHLRRLVWGLETLINDGYCASCLIKICSVVYS